MSPILKFVIFSIASAFLFQSLYQYYTNSPLHHTVMTADSAENTVDANQAAQSAADPRQTVIVIGGGLAGLSSSIEAANNGAQRVYLLDKEKKVGGNSAKATSGINGIFTEAQKKYQVDDSFGSFYNDTMKSGKGSCDPNLVTRLIEDSTKAIDFLSQHNIGMDVISQCGGHSKPRTHRASPPKEGRAKNIGWEITSKLTEYIQNHLSDKVHIITNANVVELIKDPSHHRVNAVKYIDNETGEQKQVQGHSVILATGGYGQDRNGYLTQYAQHVEKYPSTNGKFADGSGIRMAETQLNAHPIDMQYVQIHPTGFINPKNPKDMTVFLAAEALRAYGGIIVNRQGKRFVNELGRRDHVSDQIMNNCEKEIEDGHVTAYMIMNDFVGKSFSEQLFGFYKAKGFILEYENMQEAANAYNINYENLKQTIHTYNTNAAKYQKDRTANIQDEFGKVLFPTNFSLNEKTYVAKITPSIHYTMGGLKFNDKAQILDRNDQPIQGLYGAGEVTGGLHAKNRLAGNSLLECVVFGRIAGKNALSA